MLTPIYVSTIFVDFPISRCVYCGECDLSLIRAENNPMIKSLISATALSLALTVSAFAADLPTYKAPVYVPPPPPMWTGFYVGLNAGYAWGATSNATTVAAPLFDGVASAANALDPPRANGALISGVTALANTGVASVNQNGFIGGGQIGYNYQWGPSFVMGVEADIQGATISGSGGYTGAARDGMSFTDPPGLFCAISNAQGGTCTVNRSALGAGSITAGVDWMGTVRGRFGYLFTPTLLVYGTAGLAYGGAHASAAHAAFVQGTLSGFNIPIPPPFPGPFPPSPLNGTLGFLPVPGAVSSSDMRVGWTAGGGVEWMFAPNWSVKAEALYYDLGNVTLASSPVATLAPISVAFGSLAFAAGQPLIANAPATRVRFDGVMVRTGVNYHFSWFAPAPVLAR